MSTVTGTISVNVEFQDKTTSAGVQSLKTVTLRDTAEYTTGKVAIATGTAGTAQVALGTFGGTNFRDSSGALVEFTQVQRLAFSWRGATESDIRELLDVDLGLFKIRSSNGQPAITTHDSSAAIMLEQGTSTGTYTIVLYGT